MFTRVDRFFLKRITKVERYISKFKGSFMFCKTHMRHGLEKIYITPQLCMVDYITPTYETV